MAASAATLASGAAIPQKDDSNMTPNQGTSPNQGVAVKQQLLKGQGTKYGDGCQEENCWQSGACAFKGYTLPAGIDGSTCVSDAIWQSSGNCGGCIAVTYKGKKLTIMVTNRTGGGANHLDMPPATWSKLTGDCCGGGVPEIEWEWIKCPITAPLKLQMHGGSSQYWFAATVLDATYRTAKMEVNDGGSWSPMVRKEQGFYVHNGALKSQAPTVRVTSITGSQVLIKNVNPKPGKPIAGEGNYQ
ncbi:hypothetical protein IWZ01DRAFT_435980 [Phyllosticta capitalensis]